jgi:hypothetical protein
VIYVLLHQLVDSRVVETGASAGITFHHANQVPVGPWPSQRNPDRTTVSFALVGKPFADPEAPNDERWFQVGDRLVPAGHAFAPGGADTQRLVGTALAFEMVSSMSRMQAQEQARREMFDGGSAMDGGFPDARGGGEHHDH